MKKETYDVIDMHCIGCQMGVQRLLRKTEGIQRVDLLFGEAKFIVTYDENVINGNQIIDAVKRFGYQAVLESDQ